MTDWQTANRTMGLNPATRLGAYEIVALIGAGGMGEVYRARDTRLNRDVAIKVLPEEFVHDADRLARFKREAQVLASLNHPHVAAIYGVEEGPGGSALVLELVEGETLADRLASGPIPIDEALPIARQIAEALEAAHEHGIVHRDLKPANIKLTADGTVKVLDFGLAKATESAGSTRQDPAYVPNVSMSPTITSPAMTMGGVILGTAAYMSPEQAKGKPVDKRSDVWAFGCVLYEMLTGTRAFEGEDVSDTLAAILRGDPAWNLLPREASGGVATLLRRCLDRDRKRRIGDISTVLFVLNEPALTASLDAVPATAGSTRKRRERLLWAASLAAAIGATAAGSSYLRRPSAAEPERRLSVALPQDTRVGYVAISPDGSRLAVTMRAGAETRPQLWIRPLHSHEFQPLPGTFNARTPFFSPDGRMIAFFADGKLKMIPAAGGSPQVLCDGTGLGAGGTWSRNGEILFGTFAGSRTLRRVGVNGGPCTDVTTPLDDGVPGFPVFLPDDDHFLYLFGGDAAKRGVYIASLSEPNSARRLLTDFSTVLVSPVSPHSRQVHLLFLREATLVAQRFDFLSMELLGDPFPVAAAATTSPSPPQVAAGISENGVLVYLSSRPESFQLAWLDRTTGKELEKAAPESEQRGVALSTDERTVMFSRALNVWIRDVARGVESLLGERLRAPVWSPDGKRVAFATFAGRLTVREIASGKEEAIPMEAANGRAPSDWSRDDRFLLYTEVDSKTQGDIWALIDPLNLRSERKAVPVLATSFDESQAQLSPDGRWVAYTSDESGQGAVYVGAFPSGSVRRRVSPAEGREPRWRRDGRELYYLSGSSAGGRFRLMAVSVETTSTDISLGVATPLFEFAGRSIVPQGNSFQYAAGSDGGRFLVNMLANDGEPALHVITNWKPTHNAP